MEGLIFVTILALLGAFWIIGGQTRKIKMLEQRLESKNQSVTDSARDNYRNIRQNFDNLVEIFNGRFGDINKEMNRLVEAYNLLADELGLEYMPAETKTTVKELPNRIVKKKKTRKSKK